MNERPTPRRPLQEWLDLADALGVQGRFFAVHEELEDAWKIAAGSEKTLLQGLIQIAAGLHRLRNNVVEGAGAEYLFDRGLQKLEAAAPLLTPESFAGMKSELARVRAAPASLRGLRFGLRART